MAVIAKYRFNGKDMGLLALAFPHIHVLKGPPFYEFIPGKRIIVVSEDEHFSRYPDKEVIQIISSAQIAIDSREGFLRVLAKQRVKAPTEHQLLLLLSYYTDEEFWERAKIAAVVREFPDQIVPKEGLGDDDFAMLTLFDKLFEDIAAVWRSYWKLRRMLSREAIFCAVIGMMEHANRPDFVRSAKPRYRSILEKNRSHRSLFLLGLDWYVETDRDDMDILGFFAFCSAHKRPSTWPGDFCDLKSVGFDLKSLLNLNVDPEKLEAAFRRQYPTMFQ